MSNRQYQDRQDNRSQSELLDELDSLKELLDEEIDDTNPVASVSDIRSVKEYMLFKQKADEAGVDLETYLRQRAEGQFSQSENNDESDIPMLDEVFSLDSTPFDAGKPQAAPQTKDTTTISTLAEVKRVGQSIPSGQKLSLEAVEQLVTSIVEQKLQAIKPQLEKQIFDQIRNQLPIDSFK